MVWVGRSLPSAPEVGIDVGLANHSLVSSWPQGLVHGWTYNLSQVNQVNETLSSTGLSLELLGTSIFLKGLVRGQSVNGELLAAILPPGRVDLLEDGANTE